MNRFFLIIIIVLTFWGSSWAGQLVIDQEGVYDTPQKMIQATDDNFDELYAFDATIDTEAEIKALFNFEDSDINALIAAYALADQTIGIADDNLLEVDGSPNDDEFARFTANGLEGRTYGEVKSDLSLEDADINALIAAFAEPIKGADDNFVTDAEKVVIGNTSGTNTGDDSGTDDQTASEVVFTPNGNIAATDVQAAIQEVRDEAGGGGTGSVTTLKENDVQVGGADIVTVDFLGADFDLTESPDTEVQVVIAAALTRDAEIDTLAELETVSNGGAYMSDMLAATSEANLKEIVNLEDSDINALIAAYAYEPEDAAIVKSDEAETITANWVNTANPWAANELVSTVIHEGEAGTSLTALDGENLQADSVDDDSIDFTDITLSDFGLAATHDTAGELDTLYNPDDTEYNATSWNGNNDAATKNAIRDKIETMGGGSVDTSGTPADNDIAVFTDTDTIEGWSYSEFIAILELEQWEFTDIILPADGVNDLGVDWGTSTNQVSAVDIPIADSGAIITATDVEATLQENRTAINLNTAKTTALTQEQVEDYIGGMVTGNTETNITVTYEDGDGTLDFVVSDGGSPATADISDVSVTQTELEELETIGATVIEAADWTAVAAMSGVNTGDDAGVESVAGGTGLTSTGGDNPSLSHDNHTGEVTGSTALTIADSVAVTGWALGVSTATTPAEDDNDTSIATTAYVQTEISGLAPSLVTRDSLGLDTDDSPQFAGLNIGAATDTTLARSGAGDLTIEGNQVYRAGGTDVADADIVAAIARDTETAAAVDAIVYSKCITINAADADADFMVETFSGAITITQISLNQIGATNVIGVFQECDANGANCADIDTTSLTATTTKTTDSSPTNASIDAGDVISWITESVSGTNTQMMACFEYTIN